MLYVEHHIKQLVIIKEAPDMNVQNVIMQYQNKKKELFTTLKQSLPSLMLVEFDSFCLNIQTNNTKVNNIIHK